MEKVVIFLFVFSFSVSAYEEVHLNKLNLLAQCQGFNFYPG